ncbi:MAG: HAMP domain-containing histidine kinase [Candidatus Omnitrophica bacterium]|nr:HAMP domain-containing histidine kinase [Candidatus Omnitrophota bacterium]
MLERIKKIRFDSIKFKFGLFFTSALAVILVFYMVVVYFGQRYALYRDFDRKLAEKAQGVTNAINSFLPVLEDDKRGFNSAVNTVFLYEGVPLGDSYAEVQEQWLKKMTELNLRDDYIILATAEGEPVASSRNLNKEILPHFLLGVESLEKAVLFQSIQFAKQRLRLITVPYYYKNKRMYLLQVGSSLSPMNKILYGRMLFALTIILPVLAFAGLLGGMASERILSPMKKLTGIARHITYKDLSARVQVEHVDEELRYLVEAFNEMISRLDKSFRYIAQFSSNVAHELKTPLTIIKGETELALMQKRESQEYQRVIKVTQDEADGMLRIVEDLLLLSRLEYQPQVLNFERLNFSVFIKGVYEQIKKTAERKNISLKLTGNENPVLINADEVHLKRMFINLINNAVKFTHPGGRIIITSQRENKKLKVAIKDTGVGIKPQDLEKIFDRFFHADHLNQDKESGSGLGLSIVQSIIKIHDGDISVESQPQKGSTFTITLPIV